MKNLFSLFWSFLKIGAFTFGGGYAMIALIEREVIDRKGWLERKNFLELLTLAQSAPGPISLNTAVFVGYNVAGYRGAVAAVMGVVLPSFVVMLLIAMYFTDIRHNPYIDAAFKGMRPAVVALIAAPVINLVKGLGTLKIAAAIAAALIVWRLGVSPMYFIAAGAIAGMIYAFFDKKGSGGNGKPNTNNAGQKCDNEYPYDENINVGQACSDENLSGGENNRKGGAE